MSSIVTKEQLLETDYFEDAQFSRITLEEEEFHDVTFIDSTFENCTFRHVDFSECSFRDCCFIECEWTIVTLGNTMLGGVEFDQCKLMGIDFSNVNKFGFSPEFFQTMINNAVFYNQDLKKMRFKECLIFNTDFTEINFTSADFSGSEFRETIFHQCSLEKANFKNAKGYSIDPSVNKLKEAHFSQPEVMSFLAYLGIKIDE